MTLYQLDLWSAIEILANIFSIEDNIPFEEFENDNERFLEILQTYQGTKKSDPTAMKIFREHIRNGKIAQKTGVGSLYKFVYDLSNSKPIVLRDDELTGYLGYIKKNRGLDISKSLRKQKLGELQLNNNQRLFEKTHWWVYMYNDYLKAGRKNETVFCKGVTRGYLRFDSFGKVEFQTLEPGTNKVESYTGTFGMYNEIDEKNKYLFAKLKLARTNHKDLQIKIHVGTDDPNNLKLVLGQFHNFNRSVYSCAIMMEQIVAAQELNYKPQFFSILEQETNPNEIGEHVWKYFHDKRRCVLGVPSTEIIDTFSLKRWWNKRSKADEEYELKSLEMLMQKYPAQAKQISKGLK